jgi:hypothetical protein
MTLAQRYAITAALGALHLAWAAPAAHAQYPPPPPAYPVAPTYVLPSARADLTNANANMITSQEQARMMREQVVQTRLETRKKTLDTMNYERANTPTMTDDLERTKGLRFRQVVNVPAQGQILSGGAMNLMLPNLRRLSTQGMQGPPVPLDQDVLKQINVTIPGSSGNVGMLKNGGKLEWPSACIGPLKDSLDEAFPQMVDQVMNGRLDLQTYLKARKDINQFQLDLKKQFYAEQLDGASWLTAKHYLEDLGVALTALQQPSARKMLGGTYAAKGRTVDELVANMSSQGLKFAPATPGTDQAYFALYNAMAEYASAASNDSTFRVAVPKPVR